MKSFLWGIWYQAKEMIEFIIKLFGVCFIVVCAVTSALFFVAEIIDWINPSFIHCERVEKL